MCETTSAKEKAVKESGVKESSEAVQNRGKNLPS